MKQIALVSYRACPELTDDDRPLIPRRTMKTQIAIALLLVALSNFSFGKSRQGLPFINDDFQKALVQAKQRSVPLFVEVWAPW
jgi:hypothetical protein